MQNDTLFEVTQVAVIKHPRRGVLLIRSNAQAWHFPESTLKTGEAWDESLLRGIKEMTGLADVQIDDLLQIRVFDPGEVADRPQYGVFFLCRTESPHIKLNNTGDDFKWIDDRYSLTDLTLFHPLIENLIEEALE